MALANQIQNAHLLTRKASLARRLTAAAARPDTAWLANHFPRTFVVLRAAAGINHGQPVNMADIRRAFVLSGAHCVWC